jgi:hypothetical protein
MRGRLFPCFVSLVILFGAYAPVAALEPSGTDGPLDCLASPDAMRGCGDAWFKDCLKDWDATTHMSKQEFRQTCKRVAKERAKALFEIEENAARNIGPRWWQR